MKRDLSNTVKNNLLGTSLWINKLKSDCFAQNIFFAIRNNQVYFYHKGGLLFTFGKDGFRTHIKYAAVISANNEKENYLSEKELINYRLSNDFEPGYKRIMENCSKYSGYEAKGVSNLYHQYSFLTKKDVVVLDIEVSFRSEENGKKQDRIDIVLFNKLTKKIKFVEAKHFSNGDLWSKGQPKVNNQIKRYESQIAKNRQKIVSEYGSLINSINEIFGTSLPEPDDIVDKVTLLIFGFDADQKNGRLKSGIKNNLEYSGIKIYCCGNPKRIKPSAIWK